MNVGVTIGVVGLVALGLYAGAGGSIVDAVGSLITRGRQLTSSTLSATDTVLQSPAELASAASAELESYALARMVASEGAGFGLANTCRIWTAWNDAKAHGWSLFHTVTAVNSKRFPACVNTFGKQNPRRYSTARDPFEGHLRLVLRVLADIQAGKTDPTGGAVKFLNRSAMGGIQAGTKGADETIAAWRTQGLQDFTVGGVGSDLVFFRPVAAVVAWADDPELQDDPTLPAREFFDADGEAYA